uniref:ATP synthase subunit a n=2 Tax=Tetrix TaxID=58593 RepID=B6CZ26_9ORTH|nr:ATP synthase F0 subunit 6 [Tetrix japonica]YP_009734781.1 ATP synthase F0 subunit 6 [Tetrix ruyuanensis]ACC62207.1 ATPase 6 [Tetrix japonica]AFA36673.1 ATP synthase F0 subunit 6 [Tetrix japonica]QID03685.1 ATP synthase F0 subunit 6 [Tetrix ruyuanensis]
MMTNLFSSFDPSTSNSLSINWLSTLLFIMLVPMTFWLIKSRPNMLMEILTKNMNYEFNNILNNKNKGSTLLFISLFIIIMINNVMGLFPYIFTSSSHMVMTLSLALPMWLSFNLFGWINKTNHMFEHMVPSGTPAMLMPFMVCIETISTLIRPGTLAIRLAANMIAGHLLLTLLGNTGNKLSEIMLIGMLTMQMMLLVLESAVSLIQAYVFSVLTTLYSSEIN